MNILAFVQVFTASSPYWESQFKIPDLTGNQFDISWAEITEDLWP